MEISRRTASTRRAFPASVASALTLCVLAGCDSGGSRSSPAYESPEAVFKAAQTASEQKDWSGLCGVMTEESVDVMAGGLVMMSSMIKGVAPLGGEKGAEAAAKLTAVLEKHGAADAAVPAGALQGKPDAAAIRKLAEPIKDRAAFIQDVISAMESMQPPGQYSPSPAPVPAVGALEGLKIEGDTATAEVVAEGQTKPISFKKTASGWKIDLTQELIR